MAYISRIYSAQSTTLVSTTLKAVLVLFCFFTAANMCTFGQMIEQGAEDPIRFGSLNAQIKVEIFVDCQCPSCAEYNERLRSVESRYPEKVQIIFRHFPLPMHDKAMIAAKAVEAARSQGKGLEMIDLMFTTQKLWTKNPKVKMFLGFARKLGLERDQFVKDFSSVETLTRIEKDTGRAKSLKLGYTPSVLINDKLVSYVDSLDIEKIVSDGN